MSDDAWRRGSIERCRRALLQARQAGDRLALIRSMTRLQHGRLVLADEGIVLSARETDELPRFGLSVTGDGSVIRLTDSRDGASPPGLEIAERLDSTLRTTFTWASPDAILLRNSEHPTYRNRAQKSAMRAMLTMPSGAGLMVTMPTGSGKSLLFQMATRFWRARIPGACSVVITPTVSLALDHQRTLARLPGLQGSRALTGGRSVGERDELLAAFRRGEVPVLFLSPEFALGAAREALVEAAKPPDQKYAGLDARLQALFVDEAHIVESWGRSFRPDFQRLPALLHELRAANPELFSVLLSATLPETARRELRRGYGAGSSHWLEVDARTPRYDLDIVVKSYDRAETRLVSLDFLVDHAPRPLIVYTTRVEEARGLRDRYAGRGYGRLALFTGEITDAAVRQRIVEDWSNDRLDMVIATSAFGLGVDKADVRSVIHACLPEGPVRWYQEIGRASRDGHQGLAACLFVGSGHDRGDIKDAYGQATGSWLTREKAEARWRALQDRGLVATRWAVGRRRLTLDLDATRDGLSTQSNDYNRSWNMSLLNLMQRAGILEIVSVAAEPDGLGARWDVELLEDAVLGADAEAIWDRIFRVRDEEQANARSDLNAFVNLMTRPQRQCLARAVFELITPDARDELPPCGRCPACRAAGSLPPGKMPCHGLESAWHVTRPDSTALPQGMILVVPDDPDDDNGFEMLFRRLARAGIEQFILPDSQASKAAAKLATEPSGLGLMLTHSEWLDGPGAVPASLPTAVLLPRSDDIAAQLLRRSRDFLLTAPEITLCVVGRPEREIAGRRLDQSVSLHAPYDEVMLTSFPASSREVA